MLKTKLKKSLLLCALAFQFSLFAETFAGNRIFSLDLGYLGTGLKNNGWGIGLNYEIAIFDFLAVRLGFSHMTLFPSGSDIICTTVGQQFDLLFYPFFKGLEGPYVAGRLDTEFVMFPNSDKMKNETAIMATPFIGWKFSVREFVFFDTFFGYRFLLNKSQFSNENISSSLYGNKFQYGIKIKLNLKKICSSIKKRTKKSADTEAVENAILRQSENR